MRSSRAIKRAAVNRIISPLLLAMVCATASDAWARPPRAREQRCVIQTIQPNSRAMTLRCGKDAEPLELVWTKQTQFVKDWRFTESAQLKPGQQATVYYHSPFFGKKFATKVVWQSGQDDKLNVNQPTQ